MPGVTVTLTSPSQMGVRTEVTDADGSYRFSAVTPGDYVVVFELAGFRPSEMKASASASVSPRP